MDDDEFRVEVDLDDEEHGYSVSEGLRSLGLDKEAQRRLGRKVIVTRDGPRLYVYSANEEQAREAARVVRELVSADNLTGTVALTRWHPIEETWQDASIPLPQTEVERQAEYARREAAEAGEAEAQGEFDWHVVAHLPSRSRAAELADRLTDRGEAVDRRWRFVIVGVLTRERGEELANEIRAEVSPGADVTVEVNQSDLPDHPFFFFT